MRISLPRLAILIALFGCATAPKKPPFFRPSLSFQEARVERLDFEGEGLVLLYAVKNANAFPLALGSVFYLFQAHGRPLPASQPPDGSVIPPGESQLAFRATLTWTELFPRLPELAPAERLHYLATGSAGVDSPAGRLRF